MSPPRAVLGSHPPSSASSGFAAAHPSPPRPYMAAKSLPPMNPKPHDPILLSLCILAVGFLFLLFVGFLIFLASRVPIFPLCP